MGAGPLTRPDLVAHSHALRVAFADAAAELREFLAVHPWAATRRSFRPGSGVGHFLPRRVRRAVGLSTSTSHASPPSGIAHSRSQRLNCSSSAGRSSLAGSK